MQYITSAVLQVRAQLDPLLFVWSCFVVIRTSSHVGGTITQLLISNWKVSILHHNKPCPNSQYDYKAPVSFYTIQKHQVKVYTRISILRVYLQDSLNMAKYARIELGPRRFVCAESDTWRQTCHNTTGWCANWQATWRSSILLTLSKYL